MKQKTPPYKIIKKLLNSYNKDALNLKSKGLIDLPDKGSCIRLSPDISHNLFKSNHDKRMVLMWLKFQDVYEREKARGTMK